MNVLKIYFSPGSAVSSARLYQKMDLKLNVHITDIKTSGAKYIMHTTVYDDF